MITELKNCEEKMHKTVEVFKINLSKIRTGRAHVGLLDHINVDYYGAILPINQIATINVTDVKTITVQPWENKMISVIEKTIRDSDLGLNPVVNGNVVRVPMPALTEQRRKELIKFMKHESEEAKVSIRNVRRDINNELKNQFRDKLISEDQEKRTQDEVQKLTDKSILEIEKLTNVKEQELLTI